MEHITDRMGLLVTFEKEIKGNKIGYGRHVSCIQKVHAVTSRKYREVCTEARIRMMP